MDASPFPIEDQTDEDFFDKLVNDEAGSALRSGRDFTQHQDADTQSFVNPRFCEVGSSQDGLNSVQDASGNECDQQIVALCTSTSSRDIVVAESVVATELSKETGNRGMLKESDHHEKGVLKSEDFCKRTITGSGGVVKEVQWSAFNSNLNSSIDGEFDSDFFGYIEGSSAEPLGESIGKHVTGSENASCVSSAIREGTILNYNAQNVESHNHEEHSQANAAVQDTNSVEYWESLYPGWKYDHSTGQWYPVGDRDSGNSSSESRCKAQASDHQANILYSQQTIQSAVANVIGESNGGEVAYTNLTSGGTHGYPLNMVFDAQYPGWYYDTTAQEWRNLESYNGSLNQVESRHHFQILQNETAIMGDNEYTHVGYGQQGQVDSYSQHQGQAVNWGASINDYSHPQNTNMWLNQTVPKSQPVTFSHNAVPINAYDPRSHVDNSVGRRSTGHMASGYKASNDPTCRIIDGDGKISGFESFVPAQHFFQHMNPLNKLTNHTHFSPAAPNSSNLMNFSPQIVERRAQFISSSSEQRSLDGRPAHALVTFGFGGKLIVMKDCSSLSYGSQDAAEGMINVFNLIDLVMPTSQDLDVGLAAHDYFHSLCHQSFPGPLVSSNVGGKEVRKWIDEKVTTSVNPQFDYGKTENSRILFSVLKIACQYYGKLRSPFGADKYMKESDCPELALAKILASAKENGGQFTQYGAVTDCLQNLPSEDLIQTKALEVEKLLVTGKGIEALQCAQEGQLWALAIVISTLLGEQFYGETVKQMALHQMKAGSPLRTLCLLTAGQPTEVFSISIPNDNQPSTLNTSRPELISSNCMLDKWEENLAVITSNRTKGDELVITHLGDCLWKEKGQVTSAHVCYLVAEVSIESYSDSARLCLIGADHWKNPRTFATPEAIQRTELFEYAKAIGNSQFIFLPLQPYKLIYAHMLAEVGKLSDALKYCQAVLKCLKTGRAPEVDLWRNVALLLEERIKIHQQGGYAPNLASSKLVGKLLNFFDSTAHRVVGLPPTAPSTFQTNCQQNENVHQLRGSKVSASQSTMAMPSLVSSNSVEPLDEWSSGDNRKSLHSRSISEPNFSTPRTAPSPERSNPDNSSDTGSASRFGRFGSQLLQKTFGLVLKARPDRQAKLGDSNKFYYDEKLKRWVEEGVDPPPEETALPPPPTGDLMNKMSGQNTSHNTQDGPVSMNEVQHDRRLTANGKPEFRSPDTGERLSGIPPMPPSSNQFSARGRMGVRARYVDTFNKSSEAATNIFRSPSLPAAKFSSNGKANFFIPAPAPFGPEGGTDAAEASKEAPASHTKATTFDENSPFPSPPQQLQMPNSATPRHRHSSMENTLMQREWMANAHSIPPHFRRTASWSGSFEDVLSHNNKAKVNPLAEELAFPSSVYMCSDQYSGNSGDLQELAL